MYTGIIQDAQFVGPNSYLRRKVEQYKLDANHNFGRIWRITHDSTPRDRRAPADVQRDSGAARAPSRARERLVARHRAEAARAQQDKSVAGALRTMARSSANQLARIHALWTLEGLDSLDAALVRELMKSPDPQIRIQAIRASETLYKAKDKSFAADYKAMLEDRDPNVVIQAMLTLNLHRIPDYDKMIRATRGERDGARRAGDRHADSAPQSSLGQRPSLADTAVSGLNFSTDQRRALVRGESDLQGALRHLSRARRHRRADGRRARGHAAGAAAGELDAGRGHRDYVDQRAAARADRTDRRQGVSRAA